MRLFFIAGIFLTSIAAPASALPDLGAVPDFKFTSQDSKPLGLADLKGRVWVASFIFTRCQGQCPLLSSKMAELHRALGGKTGPRFVSFSVDPKNDTPQVLDAYAKRFKAQSGQWDFLTAPKEEIAKLMREGFRLGSGGGDMIAHSFRFVLVDARGHIRGYYLPTEAEKFKALKADIATLLREPIS